MQLTRVYRFSASHRLHAHGLSEEENNQLYGKCNNPHGHGHNYVLHVGVRGEACKVTGRIIDIGALDAYVQRCAIDILDHKDMNADVPEFATVVPTTENLAILIEKRLKDAWSFDSVELDRIFIRETPRNTFELRRS